MQQPLVKSAYIVLYFACWSIYRRKFNVSDVDVSKITHLIYSSGLVSPQHELDFHDRHAALWHFDEKAHGLLTKHLQVADKDQSIGLLNQMRLVKALNVSLQTGISVGGARQSGAFSSMVSTAASRKVFIHSLIDVMQKYSFDFVDFDWEYPQTAQEKADFVIFLAELHEEFAKNTQGKYISVAISANDHVIAGMPLKEMSAFVSFFNVMAYSYVADGIKSDCHNSPLFGEACIAATLDVLLSSKQLPASKIVLGIPLFGKAYSEELEQTAQYPDYTVLGFDQDGYVEYAEIIKQHPPADAQIDDKTLGAFSVDAHRHCMISHETPQTVVLKWGYVRNIFGMAGVMFWHAAADALHPHSLVECAWREMQNEHCVLDSTFSHQNNNLQSLPKSSISKTLVDASLQTAAHKSVSTFCTVTAMAAITVTVYKKNL